MTIAKKDLFDFDTLLERRGTASLKWEKYKARDIIPLWVADMDFRSPPAVIRALHELIDYGGFGYTITPDELNEAVMAMPTDDPAERPPPAPASRSRCRSDAKPKSAIGWAFAVNCCTACPVAPSSSVTTRVTVYCPPLAYAC